MAKEILKEYFKKPGTVEKWWKPEEEGKYRSCYIQQRLDVIKLSEAKGKSVLDVGTGRGRLAISFAFAGAAEVVAADISREMIDMAKKRSKEAGVADKITLCVCDAERLPFKDESFNCICCIQTFAHLPNPKEAMNELARVCKTGGIIVADAIAYGTLYRLLTKLYFSTPRTLRRLAHILWGKPLDRLEYHSVPVVNDYSRREFLSMFGRARLNIKHSLRYDIFLLVLAERIH